MDVVVAWSEPVVTIFCAAATADILVIVLAEGGLEVTMNRASQSEFCSVVYVFNLRVVIVIPMNRLLSIASSLVILWRLLALSL